MKATARSAEYTVWNGVWQQIQQLPVPLVRIPDFRLRPLLRPLLELNYDGLARDKTTCPASDLCGALLTSLVEVSTPNSTCLSDLSRIAMQHFLKPRVRFARDSDLHKVSKFFLSALPLQSDPLDVLGVLNQLLFGFGEQMAAFFEVIVSSLSPLASASSPASLAVKSASVCCLMTLCSKTSGDVLESVPRASNTVFLEYLEQFDGPLLSAALNLPDENAYRLLSYCLLGITHLIRSVPEVVLGSLATIYSSLKILFYFKLDFCRLTPHEALQFTPQYVFGARVRIQSYRLMSSILSKFPRRLQVDWTFFFPMTLPEKAPTRSLLWIVRYSNEKDSVGALSLILALIPMMPFNHWLKGIRSRPLKALHPFKTESEKFIELTQTLHSFLKLVELFRSNKTVLQSNLKIISKLFEKVPYQQFGIQYCRELLDLYIPFLATSDYNTSVLIIHIISVSLQSTYSPKLFDVYNVNPSVNPILMKLLEYAKSPSVNEKVRSLCFSTVGLVLKLHPEMVEYSVLSFSSLVSSRFPRLFWAPLSDFLNVFTHTSQPTLLVGLLQGCTRIVDSRSTFSILVEGKCLSRVSLMLKNGDSHVREQSTVLLGRIQLRDWERFQKSERQILITSYLEQLFDYDNSVRVAAAEGVGLILETLFPQDCLQAIFHSLSVLLMESKSTAVLAKVLKTLDVLFHLVCKRQSQSYLDVPDDFSLDFVQHPVIFLEASLPFSIRCLCSMYVVCKPAQWLPVMVLAKLRETIQASTVSVPTYFQLLAGVRIILKRNCAAFLSSDYLVQFLDLLQSIRDLLARRISMKISIQCARVFAQLPLCLHNNESCIRYLIVPVVFMLLDTNKYRECSTSDLPEFKEALYFQAFFRLTTPFVEGTTVYVDEFRERLFESEDAVQELMNTVILHPDEKIRNRFAGQASAMNTHLHLLSLHSACDL